MWVKGKVKSEVLDIALMYRDHSFPPNFEPSSGIYPLLQNFYVFTDFCRIL